MAWYCMSPLIGLAALAMALLTSACQGTTPAARSEVRPTISPQVTVITVSYNERVIQQRQQEVDQGHFALSISEPAYVAMDYLSTHFSEFGKVERPPRYIKVVPNRMAIVEIESGNKKYLVSLRKLARQDETGAWFVTKIEILPLGTSQPLETRIPEPFSTPPPASTPTAATPEATTVTLTGTVQDVMLSARIILLQAPVQGFRYVAWTPDTRLRSGEGQSIPLQAINAGMRIQVTGRAGSPETVIAEEVRILP